jgi:hypothetical protein
MEDFFEQTERLLKVGYEAKAEKLLQTLDLKKLEELKSKKLTDLTDADLEVIGLNKAKHEEFENFYFCQNGNYLKIYFNKEGDKYELRGFQLMKQKDILTTAELIEEAVIKWQLNYDNQ